MVMAEEFNVDTLGMPYFGGVSLADEKDVYIGWLRSEFAAANAIIDSMCQHLQSMGNPGDYDTVFSCLNKRRQPWISTLYMQQFFSVAEVVNSLQQVTQKKRTACCSSPHANGKSDIEQTCHGAPHEQSNANIKTLQNCPSSPRKQDKPTSTIYQNQEIMSDDSENGAISNVDVKHEDTDSEGLQSPDNVCLNPADSDILSDESMSTTSTDIPSHITDDSKETTERAFPIENEGFDLRELLNREVSIALKEEKARQTAIKRSTQFQCGEFMDGEMMNDGESVELCESVFSTEEAEKFAELVSQFQAAGRRGALGSAFSTCDKLGNKPDIIQFGPKYNAQMKMNDNLCMPKFLQSMIKWLTSCGILSAKKRPDSCLISIFEEGDFELPNTDQGAWERPLCLISLLGDCKMFFGHILNMDHEGSCKGPFQITVPAGSVLLLQENFAGLLQKAVPASACRRIIITLGKAENSNVAHLSYGNIEGKGRNKQSAERGNPYITNATLKPKRLGGISVGPLPDMIQHNANGMPLPSLWPFLPFSNHTCSINSYNVHPTPHGWPPAPLKLQNNSNSGTGVFFPSTELSPWQSEVLSSLTTGLEANRSGHPKRVKKHFKVRESLESRMVPKKQLVKTVSPSLPNKVGCEVPASTCPSK
ncbi:hypothetical protein KP509_39G046200 [Ceratopteris richardii]|uniref:Uncharacterized protein n=1 Tax=Ceratopteris richardii TaxID=49495 RepID=A0A8T2Q150_CERRI|nr:hypothetical protein KP509_39G046200 [Ceratopteris richardii]